MNNKINQHYHNTDRTNILFKIDMQATNLW